MYISPSILKIFQKKNKKGLQHREIYRESYYNEDIIQEDTPTSANSKKSLHINKRARENCIIRLF